MQYFALAASAAGFAVALYIGLTVRKTTATIASLVACPALGFGVVLGVFLQRVL